MPVSQSRQQFVLALARIASGRASQVNVLHLLRWENQRPCRALVCAGCNTGRGTIRAGSTAPTLLSFDHSQSQKEHSLRDLGRSKVPKRGRSVQTGQALVHLGRNRERRRSGHGMEQDQAGVPAERLDPLQRISGGGLLEVLQYAKDGVQVWANVDTDGSPLLFRLDVLEI